VTSTRPPPISCAECEKALDVDRNAPRQPCPYCGATARAYTVEGLATTGPRVSVKIKGMREGATGKRKWFRETIERWSRHRDTGKDRHELRTIDREADWYEEVIKDENGLVVRECREPLSKHQGRGEASNKHKN
jgi:hypothetical protein